MSQQSPSPEASRIANGHAWSKHAGEFPEFSKPTEFAHHIDSIFAAPSASKALRGGREAFWDNLSRTVVIKNPNDPDGGTAFRPFQGKAYFDNLRLESIDMQVQSISQSGAVVQLSEDDLLLISAALNEICHALDVREFATRMGTDRAFAERLLIAIGAASDQVEAAKGISSSASR